ncbi:MAG: ATP-binding cassette domain-containing protein [Dehalococcoidales bacterium]|nr:ATP-binding cassette domain-containing protein [Dehalococcoidales bacterium]
MSTSEHVLRVEGLTKSFGDRTVVNDVSFHVLPGEVFGFLGPNGSGKTTSIRIAQGIIQPESGSVSIYGSPPQRSVLKNIGYLPEQVGLPPKAKVLDSLRYLIRMKGLSFRGAEDRALDLLKRVGLYEHRLKKVDALSRGMRQMAQFVVAIAHQPRLIILDEPFSGLDPLNVNLMKEMLLERRRDGATIMFSTHVMSDVEEMCERIALISDGTMLLFGNLSEIKRQRGEKSVQVMAAGIPDTLQSVSKEILPDDTVEYETGDELTPEIIFQAYAASGIQVDRFERMMPSLNDIFIEEVSRARNSR